MKKRICWLLACGIVGGMLAGCGAAAEAVSSGAGGQSAPSQPAEKTIVLVASEERQQTALGRGVWQAMEQTAGQAGVGCVAIQSPEIGLKAAALQQTAGAGSLVVLLGDDMLPLAQRAAEYPDLFFIWVDGNHEALPEENMAQIDIDARHTYWLAGYIAMAESYFESGVASPPGQGMAAEAYSAGIALAVSEKTAEEMEVSLVTKVELSGADTALWATEAKVFYQLEGNCLFWGSPLQVQEVVAVAGAEKGRMVALDSAPDDEVVLAVLQRDFMPAFSAALSAWQDGNFTSGRALYGITDGVIGIDWANSRLQKITQLDFDRLVTNFEEQALQAGGA